MKYYGYFTDNNDHRKGRPFSDQDVAVKVEFENPTDLFKYAAALYLGSTWAKFVKDYELNVEELKTPMDWRDFYYNEIDVENGRPYLYFAEAENGEVIFDINAFDDVTGEFRNFVHDGPEAPMFYPHPGIVEDIPHRVCKVFHAYDQVSPQGTEDLYDEVDDMDDYSYEDWDYGYDDPEWNDEWYGYDERDRWDDYEDFDEEDYDTDGEDDE